MTTRTVAKKAEYLSGSRAKGYVYEVNGYEQKGATRSTFGFEGAGATREQAEAEAFRSARAWAAEVAS